jgi:zinc transporter, ZIP family
MRGRVAGSPRRDSSGGVAVYVAADAWLTREKGVATVRRSAHAAAGRPIQLPADQAEKTRGESMAAGLFLDGVPESFALGLTIAERATSITLLVGILVGNVVEAYGSAQPILVGGRSKRFAVGLLGGIGLVLTGSTVVGATVLADAGGSFVGTAQAAAAGAVLAVVTVAIVPHVFAEVNRLVAVASAIGFVVGYLLA